jgi:hypothetical protein
MCPVEMSLEIDPRAVAARATGLELRAKKQLALATAEKERASIPDAESALALVAALPLLKVDWELVSDQAFRNLLAALNFEASYDPRRRELTIRVTLIPELTDPDGACAPLLFVPPAGFEPAHHAPEACALSPELRGLHLEVRALDGDRRDSIARDAGHEKANPHLR